MSDQVFVLPDLGEGLTDAEVVRWLVAPGDIVDVDQAIVEVETAKSLVEVPSPYAGRVHTLHAAEGETLDVGRPLITVAALAAVPRQRDAPAEAYRDEEQAGSGNVLIGYGTPGVARPGRRRRPRAALQPTPAPAAPALAPAGPTPAPPVPVPAEPSPGPAAVTGSTPGGPPLVVSPLVRKLARQRGVDLVTVPPTGAGGVITRADVERAGHPAGPAPARPAAAAAAVPPGPAGERRIPLTGFRKAASAALSRSRAEIPEATVWVDVDATVLWQLRDSTRTATNPGPGLLAYLARFAVAGLRQYPVLNSRLDTVCEEIVQYDHINLGLAVQSERGLVVPAVRGAETLTTAGLDEEIRRITALARQGRVTGEDLSTATFTLNNYGSFGVDGSAAIINHPQVAILGFGRILDRPWVVDGEIVVRKITQMSFVFDHRVCDGGTAAGFMRSVADAIENPASAIARL